MTDALIRVALVDDHKMVRSGLALLISGSEGLQLVGEAANGLEAIQLCQAECPDVILMDLMMPEMDGLEATKAIRQAYPDTRIIVLTSFKDKELIQAALQAGAMGYLLKNASADELINAVIAAYAGKPTLAWEATRVLVDAASEAPPPRLWPDRA